MVFASGHSRCWGAYVAVGLAVALSASSAGADSPPSNQSSVASRAGAVDAPAKQPPNDRGNPSRPTTVENAVQRLASAFEAKNRYDQSPNGQKDAHEAAEGAKQAACWAGAMLWVALFETLVTLAGVFLVWRTLRQVKITADETRNTATAAKDTLSHARISSQQELRAYVDLEKIEVQWASNESAAVNVFWRNSGQTPIRRARTIINLRVDSENLADNFDFPDLTGEEVGAISLGSNQSRGVFPNTRITRAQIANVGNGTLFINVWGWIEYNDVFEGSPRHRTEFSSRLSVLAVGQPAQYTWAGGDGPFNGADEDCYRKPTT